MRTPYVASLRVYQPLEVYPSESQVQWRALAQTGAGSLATEQEFALRRAIRPQALTNAGAHVVEVAGTLYACPWATDERCQIALELFRESLPASVVSFFIPAGMPETFTTDEPEIPQIQTETWVVPPRWFTLFLPEEREVLRAGTAPVIRYRTSMAQARRRAAKHLRTIRGAFGAGSVTMENEAQARWLEEFHPRSIVELDYGGLALYLEQVLADEGGIDADTSVADVQDSLAGLESGDGLLAGAGYQRLMNRWRRVAIYEHAS